jgi:hypothetical protein
MFTDGDIKQYLYLHGDQVFYMSLLARLEAAERCINGCRKNHDCVKHTDAFEAWRKASGK